MKTKEEKRLYFREWRKNHEKRIPVVCSICGKPFTVELRAYRKKVLNNFTNTGTKFIDTVCYKKIAKQKENRMYERIQVHRLGYHTYKERIKQTKGLF